MRNLKTGVFILLMAVFTTFSANTQENKAPTMYAIHTDNVSFKMVPKYEKLSMEFKTLCEENSIKNMNWMAISVEDGRYVYVTPIENMAELDKQTMDDLEKKVGEEKLNKLFSDMDTCYDSHGDEIIYFLEDLSYAPKDYTTDGKNEREYHFLYYPPKHYKAMYDAMKKVKNMFKDKGIKNGYEVFHSGFGSNESYFMVSIAGTSEMDFAKDGEENDKLLGDEKDAAFWEVIKLTSKYDQVEATIRPDLSYFPKQD